MVHNTKVQKVYISFFNKANVVLNLVSNLKKIAIYRNIVNEIRL